MGISAAGGIASVGVGGAAAAGSAGWLCGWTISLPRIPNISPGSSSPTSGTSARFWDGSRSRSVRSRAGSARTRCAFSTPSADPGSSRGSSRRTRPTSRATISRNTPRWRRAVTSATGAPSTCRPCPASSPISTPGSRPSPFRRGSSRSSTPRATTRTSRRMTGSSTPATTRDGSTTTAASSSPRRAA